MEKLKKMFWYSCFFKKNECMFETFIKMNKEL